MKARTLFATFGAYTLLWLLTRWSAIAANTLFFDDYALPADPVHFYIGSYRPLVYLEYSFWELVVPNHFWTMLPKLTAAAYLGAAMTALALLLHAWSVPKTLAFLAPLGVIANPVLNDTGLWSSLHAVGLSLLLITAAMIVWERSSSRRWTYGALIVLMALLGYQIFVSLALVFIVAEPVIKRTTGAVWRLRESLVKTALIGVAALVQMSLMQWIRHVYPAADQRGFAEFTSLAAFASAKLHGIFNLSVNAVMPVIAYYTSAQQAASTWKWVPLGVAGAGCAAALVKRQPRLAAILLALPIVLFFLPGLPVLALSVSPWAWRVSAPTAFALILAMMPALILVSKQRTAIGEMVLGFVALVMIPVAWDESRMRVESNRRTAVQMQEIEDYWRAHSVPMRDVTIAYVGPETEPAVEVPELAGPRELTWGYSLRTPLMWSPFTNEWVAQHYVRDYRGLRFARWRGKAPANGVPARTWPRFVHVPELRTTIVCASCV